MYHHLFRKSAPLTALFALAALGGTAAHAGQNVFDPNGTAAQLGAGAAATTPYSAGTPSGVGTIKTVSSPYTVTSGGQTITFNATGEAANSKFESLNNQGQFDFAAGTQLLDTFDPNTNTNTGPLEIDFSKGVTAFGLSAQDSAVDQEVFTFSTYNGAALVGTYTSPLFDNRTGSGKSVFLGAQATGGDIFTRVVISSQSFPDNPNNLPITGSNDFYFGPLNVVPVPEASSMVSLGMVLALLGGVTLIARRRRGSRASQRAL